MADARFDLSFDGTLAPGTDPDTARQRLGALFKLDDQGVARLFSGKIIVVKRDADANAVSQFERAFLQAGAVLRVTHVGTLAETAGTESAAPSADRLGHSASTSAQAPGLTLAPPGGFIEAPPEVKIPDLDTSHLSLVSDPDWSLADCESEVSPTRTPDTSHLALAEPERKPDDDDTAN